MGKTLALALGAIPVAVFLACGGRTSNGGDGGTGGSSGSSSGGFPFTGPSCTSAQIDPGCWQCTVADCNGGCVTRDCSTLFQCFCACPAGDTQCQDGCQPTTTCQTCLDGINQCDSSGPCKSSCPITTTACAGADCANGSASIEMCTVSHDGTCTAAYYQVGSEQFSCTSCTDTSACQMAAQMACH